MSIRGLDEQLGMRIFSRVAALAYLGLAVVGCSTSSDTGVDAGVGATGPAQDSSSGGDSQATVSASDATVPSDSSAALANGSDDAGTPLDSGADTRPIDASQVEATQVDASPIDGSEIDASVTDATSAFDAVAQDSGASPGDGGCAASGGLLINGSFECPVTSVGGFTNFNTGGSFEGWTVVGANGAVSVLSGAYAQGGYVWTAEDGVQTLDLTGDGSNSATGVQQVVATSAGTLYTLSFWLGNIVDAAQGWGTTSTVNVMVDGVQAGSAINSGSATGTLYWQQFQVQFMAASSSTTIALINGDPSNDNSNILDDVTLN
jgi:hypothetical protein